MPQTFQVLKCYKCLVFQVHQLKKSNKFGCKMCGEKQSIKRHYGVGTGQECRMQVQKLNGIRGEIDELKTSYTEDTDEGVEDDDKVSEPNNVNDKHNTKKQSKWSEYVEIIEDKQELAPIECMYVGDREVMHELPRKRQKYSTKCIPKHRREALISHNMIEIGGNKSVPRNVDVTNNFSTTNPDDFENIQPKTTKVEPLQSNNFTMLESPDVSTQQKRKHDKFMINLTNINKNSKWLQFVEDSVTDSGDSEQCLVLDSDANSVKQNVESLFSLCDDSDLDTILNI